MFSTLISRNLIKGVEINTIGFMFSIYVKTAHNIFYCIINKLFIQINYDLIQSQADIFLNHYSPHVN
jgi:hypothetical protein